MRLFVFILCGILATSALAQDAFRECPSLLQTASQLHNPRLPLPKRLRAAAEFRDHALRQLDRAGVLWADMPDRPDSKVPSVTGITVVPVRNGVELNDFAAGIAEDFDAHYEFDLGYLATRMAGAAVRLHTTYASLLGSKEAILELAPGVYERHELDHLEIDRLRNQGIPSVFHGALTQHRSDEPYRFDAYPYLSFDELYAYARDLAYAVQAPTNTIDWRAILVTARRLRRISSRVGNAAREAIVALDQGDEEGWFEWTVLRQRPDWRIPTFRFLNVVGRPEVELADYAEPVMLEPSRFPTVQIPKLIYHLMTKSISHRRRLQLAKRTLLRIPPLVFAAGGLLTTSDLILRFRPGSTGESTPLQILLREGTEWHSFDVPVDESRAYVQAVFGDGTDYPRHRLPSFDAIFRVARERFGQLADVCDVIREQSDRIATAVREARYIEATDLALAFEPFFETLLREH